MENMPNVPFYQRIKAFGKEKQKEIIGRFSNGAVVNEHTGLTPEQEAINEEIVNALAMLRAGTITPEEFQAKMDDPRYDADDSDDYDFSRLTPKERKRYEKLDKFFNGTELQHC